MAGKPPAGVGVDREQVCFLHVSALTWILWLFSEEGFLFMSCVWKRQKKLCCQAHCVYCVVVQTVQSERHWLPTTGRIHVGGVNESTIQNPNVETLMWVLRRVVGVVTDAWFRDGICRFLEWRSRKWSTESTYLTSIPLNLPPSWQFTRNQCCAHPPSMYTGSFSKVHKSIQLILLAIKCWCRWVGGRRLTQTCFDKCVERKWVPLKPMFALRFPLPYDAPHFPKPFSALEGFEDG